MFEVEFAETFIKTVDVFRSWFCWGECIVIDGAAAAETARRSSAKAGRINCLILNIQQIKINS